MSNNMKIKRKYSRRKACRTKIANQRDVLLDLMGREYKLGAYKAGGPLDCWGLVREYILRVYGFDLLSEIDDYTITSYKEIYALDPLSALKKFSRILDKCLIKVSPGYLMCGDIVKAMIGNQVSIGLYAGNDSFLVTRPKTGSFFIKLSSYKKHVGYRWPLRYQ